MMWKKKINSTELINNIKDPTTLFILITESNIWFGDGNAFRKEFNIDNLKIDPLLFEEISQINKVTKKNLKLSKEIIKGLVALFKTNKKSQCPIGFN